MNASIQPTPSRLAAATRPEVVRRAFRTAVVVGAGLIAINHGDAILAGRFDWVRV